MKGRKRCLLCTCISFCLVMLLLLPGCEAVTSQTGESGSATADTATAQVEAMESQGASKETAPNMGAPTLPMTATLLMSEAPVLEKPVQITATLAIGDWYDKGDAPNTEVELLLPEGFELVSGSLKSTVEVLKEKPATVQATVKSVKTGIWQIEVRAVYILTNGDGPLIANNTLYTVISEDSAEVSEQSIPVPRRWNIAGEQGKTVEPTLPPIPIDEYVPLDIPSSSQLEEMPSDEGDYRTGVITIRGEIICPISENEVPQNQIPREDEWSPMVWGGVRWGTFYLAI